MNLFLYFESCMLCMCNEIEYQMIMEMLQKTKKKEQKTEKPIEVLAR